MPFLTPDYLAIRDAILRDISNQLPEAATGPDSDYTIRANAVGAAIEGLYQHQQWLVRQILPDTADTDNLERWCSLFGLARKTAAAATGNIVFSGVAGSAIPIGTEAKANGGTAFVTTVAGSIGAGGTTSISARASVPGVGGNQVAATVLTLTSAPAGVQSLATILAMTGGSDAESNADLLARLLDRIRQPPHGGAAHDYRRWALEVAGVTAAWVYPLRRGLGTLDVVIVTSGGIPSAQLVADTQAHIEDLRPVTANCLVRGPDQVLVNVTATLTLTSATLKDAAIATIQAAITAYFADLIPGGVVYRNRIAAIISDTAGVVDFTLTSPAANIATVIDATRVEMPIIGIVSLL